MKISIITYTSTKNFGGILQSYGLYSHLQNEGYEVEFIDYIPERCNIDNPDVYTDNILKNSRVWGKTRLTKNIWKLIKFPKIKKSYAPFLEFLRSRVKFSRPYYSYEELCNDYPRSDLYITGSDQVWNSSFCRDENIDEPYYLSFLDKERRISYASSFGKDSIPEKNKLKVKANLEKYESLSVRENSGIQILKTLGLSSTKVVDPTLLCDKNIFEKLCLDSINDDYIVLYQVHFEKSVFYLALKVSKYFNKKLIVISTDSARKRKIKNCEFINPNIHEWLTYIKYSYCVITDSFHACIFSILFERNFLVNTGTRKHMSTRIDDLLEMLSLENRKFNGNDVLLASNLLKDEIDWGECNNLLNNEKEKSRDWLKEAIGIESGIYEHKY